MTDFPSRKARSSLRMSARHMQAFRILRRSWLPKAAAVNRSRYLSTVCTVDKYQDLLTAAAFGSQERLRILKACMCLADIRSDDLAFREGKSVMYGDNTHHICSLTRCAHDNNRAESVTGKKCLLHARKLRAFLLRSCENSLDITGSNYDELSEVNCIG